MNHFKCKICDELFLSKSNHLMYMHNITTKQYYDLFYKDDTSEYCFGCGKRRKFVSLKSGYSNGKIYRNYCGRCVSKKRFENIKLSEDELRVRKCKNLRKYRQNKQRKIGNDNNYKYRCSICDSKFKSVSGLSVHIRQIHNVTYKEYNSIYVTLPVVYCDWCNSKLDYIYNSAVPKIRKCKCKYSYRIGALKREKKFKETVLNNGNTMKQEIMKSVGEKISKILKKKIQNGLFTPNITNSWCKSRIEVLDDNNKSHSFRSSWEAYFFIKNQHLQYEKIRIPYSIKNINHSYIIDFVDEHDKILYEIKPKSELSNELNKVKINTAIEWSRINNYKFVVISDEWFVLNVDKSVLSNQPNKDLLINRLKKFIL